MTCRPVYTPYVRKGFVQFMEETNELLQFVIESTKNEKTPVKLRELCREFKETSGNPNSALSLVKRLQTLKIHEMNNLTIDTKVRLIFAMSIPIDPDFFTELQYQATVKIDNHQRIVEYETIGGGLKLSGKHFPTCPEIDRKNRIMLMFLARKTETVDYPLSPTIFMDEFEAKFLNPEKRRTAVKRYRELKNKIYWATEYDKVTRMKMMFISGGKVPECFLRELREDALVDVDEENRIILYQSIDGSLNLQGDHSLSIKMMMVADHRKRLHIEKLESNKELVEVKKRETEEEETIVDMPSMKRNERLTKYDVEWWPSMRTTAITKKRIKEEHNYAAFNNQYIDTIPVQESIPSNNNSDLIDEVKNEND
ncbi:hypothetical protein GCK72_009243 [Caenorhabditis remanei]|uniref:SPK domain-containing protein n=1 Tax=Caenorhabditis remanei TaxID=31234 RepID=A0A6A5GZP5_CAERE|nr:hypothetical protein GCK72_009243 [Caenorhabditis remanei]KAF1760990.1 hypothetical protein GCK72_009243 [Caenorhabditis remanei]